MVREQERMDRVTRSGKDDRKKHPQQSKPAVRLHSLSTRNGVPIPTCPVLPMLCCPKPPATPRRRVSAPEHKHLSQ